MAQDLEAGTRPTTCPTEVDAAKGGANCIGSRPPRTRAWRDGKVIAEGFPVEEVSDHLAAGDVVWLDLCSPQKDELHVIAEELNLHSLSVEDAVSTRQRAKLDRYADYLFLNAYDVALDMDSGQLTTSELSAFITKSALVTVQDDDRFDVDALLARWDSSPDLTGNGISFLLHGLLDMLVDDHFRAVEALDEAMEELEDLLFDDRPRGKEVQRRTFELRKSLVLLRRVVLPMREVVNTLLRRDLHVVDEAMAPYFQDVYDHVLRAAEWTESIRDLIATALDTNLAIQGNRLNLIMKKLTGWAAVIAVPTAVTGFYGQNVPYPGFGREWGFVVSVFILVGTAGALWLMFKKRDWL
jgi:magnesium transporter